MEFITSNGQKISREAILMVILVTGGVGEGNMGKVTTFCCHGQVKMEASDALSALYQCDSLEPSVVLVRRYTNIPYIPWGSSCLPYLDESTLCRGTSSAQFPLDQLCIHRLLPFLDTEVVFPQEVGEMGLKMCPPIQPIFTISPFIGTSALSKKRAHRWREDWAFTQP